MTWQVRQRGFLCLAGVLLLAVVVSLIVIIPAQGHSGADAGKGGAGGEATPGAPVVRAVMFWLRGCPHCHEVIENVLPALEREYGQQFQLHLIELEDKADVDAYYAIAESVGVSKMAAGVPFLIIGKDVLIGSDRIRNELPALIDHYLAQGGVDYPDLLMLKPYLPTPTAALAEVEIDEPPIETAEPASPAASLNAAATVERDNGFGLAIGVLLFMAGALVYSGWSFILKPEDSPVAKTPGDLRQLPWYDWLTLLLALAGLGVAGYLAYVETQAASAVCGPVGDCNAVQRSEYARLLGVLPVGVLGAAGYAAILATWAIRRLAGDRPRNLAALALFGMVLIGQVFSLYLTFLEPFVIRAVCLWCLSSSVIMSLLLVLNVRPARAAVRTLLEGEHAGEKDAGKAGE